LGTRGEGEEVVGNKNRCHPDKGKGEDLSWQGKKRRGTGGKNRSGSGTNPNEEKEKKRGARGRDRGGPQRDEQLGNDYRNIWSPGGFGP